MQSDLEALKAYFNPRPPRGGRLHLRLMSNCSRRYFNPRPPRGGRPMPLFRCRQRRKFQSTPSARRATVFDPNDVTFYAIFQSTPSARRATMLRAYPINCQKNFNPRPPRGGRLFAPYIAYCTNIFQSTPSARRATRDWILAQMAFVISIHALREEGDHSHNQGIENPRISIHALREEGDPLSVIFPVLIADFNPRPPRGGRQNFPFCYRISDGFQSTPSARRATKRDFGSAKETVCISIHALREEGDKWIFFQHWKHRISIHALREEGDWNPGI